MAYITVHDKILNMDWEYEKEYLIDLVQPSFVKHAFPATEPTRFGLAILGNDAGIYGAAKLILDSKM